MKNNQEKERPVAKSVIGWQNIRTLGNLLILTRASYAMLVFVPVLSGVWPAVRAIVNHYNNTIITARNSFRNAAERLEAALSDVENHDRIEMILRHKIQEVKDIINELKLSYENIAIENPNLPIIWIITFFASLCVAIAQTLYQGYSGDIVKKYSKKEYIENEQKRYSSFEAKDQLDTATDILKDKPEWQGIKIKRLLNPKDFIFDHEAFLFSPKEEERESDRIASDEKILKSERLKLIGAAAENIYDGENYNDSKKCYLSATFYFAGLFLIAIIILYQIRNIFIAAGLTKESFIKFFEYWYTYFDIDNQMRIIYSYLFRIGEKFEEFLLWVVNLYGEIKNQSSETEFLNDIRPENGDSFIWSFSSIFSKFIDFWYEIFNNFFDALFEYWLLTSMIILTLIIMVIPLIRFFHVRKDDSTS